MRGLDFFLFFTACLVLEQGFECTHYFGKEILLFVDQACETSLIGPEFFEFGGEELGFDIGVLFV